jgi:hypothetical protein
MANLNISVQGNGRRTVKSSAATALTNGAVLFTVVGDILIRSLVSECIATGTPTATTLQWQSAPTIGAPATFTGATASLISAVAGTNINIVSGQTTAPAIVISGASNEAAYPLATYCPAGTINSVVTPGTSTSTWVHYLMYEPLEDGAYATAT